MNHGAWIWRDDGEGLRRVCSECGREGGGTRFCPHCSAGMVNADE